MRVFVKKLVGLLCHYQKENGKKIISMFIFFQEIKFDYGGELAS